MVRVTLLIIMVQASCHKLYPSSKTEIEVPNSSVPDDAKDGLPQTKWPADCIENLERNMGKMMAFEDCLASQVVLFVSAVVSFLPGSTPEQLAVLFLMPWLAVLRMLCGKDVLPRVLGGCDHMVYERAVDGG